jgi:hypothetical protein
MSRNTQIATLCLGDTVKLQPTDDRSVSPAMSANADLLEEVLAAVDRALDTNTLDAYRSRREQTITPFFPGDATSRLQVGDRIASGEDVPANGQLSASTLRRWSWTARCVPPSIRREGLSLSHYEAVAPLTRAEQIKWIGKAVRHGLSAAEIARQIKKSGAKRRGAGKLTATTRRTMHGRRPIGLTNSLAERR